MAGGQRFETRLTFFGFKPLHYLALLKGGQGTVDRIQGEGRQPVGQSPVQGFRRRMVMRLEQLPINLQALLGNLESGSLAYFLELAEQLLKIVGRHQLNKE